MLSLNSNLKELYIRGNAVKKSNYFTVTIIHLLPGLLYLNGNPTPPSVLKVSPSPRKKFTTNFKSSSYSSRNIGSNLSNSTISVMLIPQYLITCT